MAKQDFERLNRSSPKTAKLEPNYKDASSLQAVAYLEPLYRAGKADLEAGHYRKAYDELGRVVEKDPGYKDSGVLRQEALTKGQYSIAVLPFTTSTKRTDVTSRVQAHAMTSLVETKLPLPQDRRP